MNRRDAKTQKDLEKGTTELYNAIDKYNKDRALGISSDLLEAFVDHGRLKWKINPKGHVDPIRTIIDNAEVEFETAMKKLEADNATTFHRVPVYEKATKTILEAALIGFDYEEQKDNPQAGRAVLGYLAREIAHFLVVNGGKDGFQHSQMLSRLTTLRHSASLLERSRNTASLATTSSD